MTASHPQPVRHYPLPQCLDAQAQALTRRKVSRAQMWGRNRDSAPGQRQNRAPEGLAMVTIARATALAGNQPRCAIRGERQLTVKGSANN